MKTKKKKGFTLTELIVVIVIIGVLAAVLIPSLTGYITKAQNAKDETRVISLNRELSLRKLDDNLNFYTCSDVQAYLESVGMANLEVANKDNIILFDAEDYEFILVKKDEKDKVLEVNKYATSVSEYYYINKTQMLNLSSSEKSNVTLKPLSSTNTNGDTLHRAFIISINGNEVSETVAAFMKISSSISDNDFNKIIKTFKSVGDTTLIDVLNSALSKTLFIDKDESFYIDTETYGKNEFTDDTSKQLTRIVILSDVKEVDLTSVKDLEQATIIIPTTVETVIIPKDAEGNSTLDSSIELSGNIDAISNEDQEKVNIINIEEATIKQIVKELINVPTKVTSQDELLSIISCYNKLQDPEITKLMEDYDIKKTLDKVIIVYDDFTITSNILIPEGVTLFVPYDLSKTNLNIDSDDYSGIPDHANTSLDEWKYSNLPFAHTVYEKGKLKYKTVELTIDGNLTIGLNGKIIIGGITGDGNQGMEGHTTGNYGQITLNGNIILEQGAKIDCYGYIMGNGQITAKNGSEIIQPFVIGDFDGGTISYNLTNLNRASFDKYALINVQCNILLEYGSKYRAMPKIFINSNYSGYSNIVDIISNTDGLIAVSENTNVLITYEDEKKLSENDAFNAVGKTTIHVYGVEGFKGGAETGSLSVNISVSGVSSSVDTSKYALSVPYNFTYKFSNGNYFVKTAFAFLPGSEFIIDNDATVTIEENGKIYLLDGEHNNMFTTRSTTNYVYPKKELLESKEYANSGKLYVNGSLYVRGTLAGEIDVNTDGSNKTQIVMYNSANTKCNYHCVKQWSGAKSLKDWTWGHQYGITVSSVNITMYTCSDDEEGECWQLSPTTIIFGTESTEYELGGAKIDGSQLNNGWVYKYNTENEFKGSEAKFVSVGFECIGEGADFGLIETYKGGSLSNVLGTIKEVNGNAYKLMGIYKDNTCNDIWDFETDLVETDTLTLYTKWKKVYIINFYDGNDLLDKTYYDPDVDTKIEQPINPQKSQKSEIVDDITVITNYQFDKWYTDESLTSEWKYSSGDIKDNLSLYAKWNENKTNWVTVTFHYKDSDGNDITREEVISIGITITRPTEDPSGYKGTLYEYVFEDWYTNGDTFGGIARYEKVNGSYVYVYPGEHKSNDVFDFSKGLDVNTHIYAGYKKK